MAGVSVLSRLNSMPSGLSVCTCIYTHMYMHTVHAYIHVHIHTCILFIPVSWQMASTSQLLCNFMVNIGMNNSLFDIYLQFLWLFIIYVRWKGTAVAYGNSVCRLWRSLHTPLQTWVPSHKHHTCSFSVHCHQHMLALVLLKHIDFIYIHVSICMYLRQRM